MLVLVLCASAMFTLEGWQNVIRLEDDFSDSTDLTLGFNPLNVLEATDTNIETRNNLCLSEPLSHGLGYSQSQLLEARGHYADHPYKVFRYNEDKLLILRLQFSGEAAPFTRSGGGLSSLWPSPKITLASTP